MRKSNNALAVIASKTAHAARSGVAKAAAAGTALMASAGSALAQSSPGAAIAAGLSDGPSEMGLVFAGVAVLIGLLLLWVFIRRAAKG